MNENETLNLNRERQLQQQIRGLAKEQETDSDLWPRIEKTITRNNIQKHPAPRWIPWAIAASLLVSVGSVTFSWRQLQEAKFVYSDVSSTKQFESSASTKQVRLIETSYYAARRGLLNGIGADDSVIDKKLLSEIADSLAAIKSAAELIKTTIKENPENGDLPLMLNTLYRQELDVLSGLVSLDNSI